MLSSIFQFIKKICNKKLIVVSLFSLLAVLSIGYIAYGQSKSQSDITIVVDAGHGGYDSGKISILGDNEKDINLAIALKLSKLLDNAGYNVIMTRESDVALGSGSGKAAKSEDLAERSKLMSDNTTLSVSIHQNSYTSSDVYGPQVFYYSQSKEGEQLAAVLQDLLNDMNNNEQPRSIKANSDYYILKNSKSPTVIVECGFLSNPKEAADLKTSEYQDKLARTIYLGITHYLREN